MKKKNLWWLVVISAVVLAKVLLGKYLVYSYFKHFITIEQIKENSAWLLATTASHYFLAVVSFILGYAVMIGIGIPGVVIFSLLGGFLFGTWLGMLYSTIAATLGSAVVFLIIRYLMNTYVQRRYAAHLATFNRYMERYGSSFLLIVHYMAVIPFFIINILAALTRVRLWTFAWTTVAGFIPLCWIYASAGCRLATLDSFDDLFSWQIFVMLAVLILMALIPVWVKHHQDHADQE